MGGRGREPRDRGRRVREVVLLRPAPSSANRSRSRETIDARRKSNIAKPKVKLVSRDDLATRQLVNRECADFNRQGVDVQTTSNAQCQQQDGDESCTLGRYVLEALNPEASLQNGNNESAWQVSREAETLALEVLHGTDIDLEMFAEIPAELKPLLQVLGELEDWNAYTTPLQASHIEIETLLNFRAQLVQFGLALRRRLARTSNAKALWASIDVVLSELKIGDAYCRSLPPHRLLMALFELHKQSQAENVHVGTLVPRVLKAVHGACARLRVGQKPEHGCLRANAKLLQYLIERGGTAPLSVIGSKFNVKKKHLQNLPELNISGPDRQGQYIVGLSAERGRAGER